MNLGFYEEFLGLNPEDRQYFKFLTEEDDDFVCLIEDSAFIWRNHLRKLFPDPIECRRDFLAKSLALGTKNGLRNEGGSQLAAAFALYFTDRVEQRVRQLDAEQKICPVELKRASL